MPYTPYTLQTLVSKGDIEKVVQGGSPESASRFSFRSSGSPTSSTSYLSSSPTKLNARFNQLVSPSGQRVRIDAVDTWGNHLYLGTSNGQVLHFVLEERQQKPGHVPSNAHLENRIELGSKPVDRILVIPQVSKAIVLHDSTVSFYALPFFTPIPPQSIAPIKGVSCFTHDLAQEGKIGQDGTVELCVVKRRSMQLFKLGEYLQFKKEIPLQDGAISITRFGKLFCLADHQEYKLISGEPVSTIPLIPTPREPASASSPPQGFLSTSNTLYPSPVAAVVKGGEFLLVSGSASGQSGHGDNQTIGIFIDARGSAIHGTMQWSSYPKAICVEYPYIAALLRNNTIQVHNIANLQLLQTIDLPSDFEPRGMLLGHGLKVQLDDLARRLTKRPWVPSATQNQENDEDELQLHLKREAIRFSTVPARILVYGANSVLAQIVTPLLLQINNLIDSNRIEEAMEMTDQARNSMSSTKSIHVERMRSELDYIYQKCGMLMLKETVFEDAFSLFSKGDVDPRLVIHFFGNRLSFGDGAIDPADPVLLFDDIRLLVEELGMIDDIVAKAVQHDPDANSANSMRKVLLANAREAAQKYLLTERGKRRDVLGKGQPVCKAIDTAIFKLYVMNDNDTLLRRLLREPNDCDLDACKVAIWKAKKYYALCLFLESKKQYKDALELWTRIYDGALDDEAFDEDLDQLKQRLLRTADLTQPLVLEYTWWLMEHGKMDAVDILIASPFAATMDADAVLARLKQFDIHATKTYLEYLVLTKKSTRAVYHTQLARTYIEALAREINDHAGNKELITTVQNFKAAVNPMEPNRPSPTFVAFLGSQAEPSRLQQERLLLLRLLQQSDHYDANSLLQLLDKTGPLQIEKTIIYGKLGRHQDALNILIHDLGDFVGAEIYCATNGQSTGMID